GVIVGIVALPLAIALAIASGVGPERGLFTAIVAGFLISALGGSRVQIGGPTGAFVVIVYAIVQRHGVDGLAMATLMAGLILVGFGVARLGAAIKFIPYPVTIGFTSGIAVIIFSNEVKDFLGLRMGPVPADFVPKWPALPASSMHQLPSLAGAAFTIALLGAIESLLSAVVADGMIGGRHRSNMELVAQGIANIASPLFGGIPATGAIARTATNVKNGG